LIGDAMKSPLNSGRSCSSISWPIMPFSMAMNTSRRFQYSITRMDHMAMSMQ